MTLDGMQALADNEAALDQLGVRVIGARKHGIVIRHPGQRRGIRDPHRRRRHAVLEELTIGLTCPVS
jgi:hypothetical protein